MYVTVKVVTDRQTKQLTTVTPTHALRAKGELIWKITMLFLLVKYICIFDHTVHKNRENRESFTH